MTKLIISLVTWNHEDCVTECLKSVADLNYKDFTLVIVDNNSEDNTVASIKAVLPSIKNAVLIQSDKNLGFCGGHNYVFNNYPAEYYLLLNPDITISSDYLTNAFKQISASNFKKLGGVCGLLVQDASGAIDSAGMVLTNDGRFKLRYNGQNCNDIPLKIEKVDGMDGALPLFTGEFVRSISYKGEFFDEMFFAHKEDWDVSWRGLNASWEFYFIPECKAVHPRYFRQSNLNLRENISPAIKYHAVKNQYMLLIKNLRAQYFIKNFFFIFARQFAILIFISIFERKSLKALSYIAHNWSVIWKKREYLRAKGIESNAK